jgi:hypothetical protein
MPPGRDADVYGTPTRSQCIPSESQPLSGGELSGSARRRRRGGSATDAGIRSRRGRENGARGSPARTTRHTQPTVGHHVPHPFRSYLVPLTASRVRQIAGLSPDGYELPGNRLLQSPSACRHLGRSAFLTNDNASHYYRA